MIYMKKDFMAVILGSDENAYGFARSLHKKYGVVPIALATTILEVCEKTKIIDFMIDKDIHKEEHLIDVLVELAEKLKKEYEKIVLIPCSDSYMEMCVKNAHRLKDYENAFIDYDTYCEFNLKEKFYEMCDKYGLPYPKTVACNKDNYRSVVRKIDFGYPLILKPNNSNSIEYLNASFEGKEKVYFIDDEKELLEKIESVYSSSYKGDLLIQKFVSGDDTQMRVLNVYSDKMGKVKVMSLGQPILEEYHPSTYGNYAAITSIVGMVPIMEKIKSFLESIGYKGASNFDIKIDNKTGEYYLFEINPRPGRSSFVTTLAGASIQEAFIEDLVYDRLSNRLGNTREILWLNVPPSLLKKYIKNRVIMEKVMSLKKKKSVYHTLKYEEDWSLGRKMIFYKQYLRKIHYYPKYYIEKK